MSEHTAEPARVDLASVANDPYVAVLCQEAQSIFGKTLSRSEMQRLVGLYLNDGWQPDVILLCCAEVTRLGRRTIAAVTHLLARWREDGVDQIIECGIERNCFRLILWFFARQEIRQFLRKFPHFP